VTLSGPAPTDVLLSYRTTDGTGTGGLDYHSTTGTLRIPAGESVGVISVPVVGDTLDEPQEDFTLSLTTVSGATIADGTAVGTILDDDEPPTVSITDASAVESDSMITFTVALSAPSGGTVSVAYATANGTAMSGKDYKRVLGTLKIPAGQTTATISAPLLNDALDETDERFSVLLSSPSGTTISDGEGVGTIIDDDPDP
jgi:chitinase